MSASGLPEDWRYQDEGCAIAPRCLECPRARCVYDVPESVENTVERDTYIVELRKEGMPPSELARAFRISSRSVHRILQRGGPSEAAVRFYKRMDAPQPEPARTREPVYKQRRAWPQLPVRRSA